MSDFSSVKEIREGVWEIVDEFGDSVFSTHCTKCGNQFFFGDIRLMDCVVVCKPCKDVILAPILVAREEVIQPSARVNITSVLCKNFDVCGEMMERSQGYTKNPTCYPCKKKEQSKRERTYA